MSRPHDWFVLDLDADPTPGDPWRVRELATRYRELSADAERAARDVRSLAGDRTTLNWIGAAGDEFREHIGAFGGKLDKVTSSHSLAADALKTLADRLQETQAQADRALARGREARAQIAALQAPLGPAATLAESLTARPAVPYGTQPPDPDQVRAALARHEQGAALRSALAGPTDELEAARRLALQAAALREDADHSAARAIRGAQEEAIPPDSFWNKLGDLAARAWKGVVETAKVVVVVGGIIALVIGGPLAWVVFAAALIVLADTLAKYGRGEASLWEVGLAALACIPMTRGLTSLTEIKAAASFGAPGMLKLGSEIAVDTYRSLRAGVPAIWQGREAIPGLLRALPYTASGKLTSMATDLRYGAAGARTGFGVGFRDGGGVFGSFASGLTEAAQGWRGGVTAAETLPSQAARAWQGSAPYLGRDGWSDTVIQAGTKMEALHPRLSGYMVPEGTVGSLGGDSAAISGGVQVGPSAIDPDINVAHNFRTEAVTLRFESDVPAASSTAIANPHFGPGGLEQAFVPDVLGHIRAGDIAVVDSRGNVLVVSETGVVDLGAGQSISLHNLDLAPSSAIPTTNLAYEMVRGAGTTVTGVVGADRATTLAR